MNLRVTSAVYPTRACYIFMIRDTVLCKAASMALGVISIFVTGHIEAGRLAGCVFRGHTSHPWPDRSCK